MNFVSGLDLEGEVGSLVLVVMVLGLENEEDGDAMGCEREVERDPEGGGGTELGREAEGSSAKEPLHRVEHAPTDNHILCHSLPVVGREPAGGGRVGRTSNPGQTTRSSLLLPKSHIFCHVMLES